MRSTAALPGQENLRVHVHPPFPGNVRSIHDARTWATRIVAESGLVPPEWLDLLVGELANNAVIHTHSGNLRGSYRLRITILADRIRVEVRDDGPLPGRTPTRLHASPYAESGRGLALVETFATRWGTLAVGTGVWAEVPR